MLDNVFIETCLVHFGIKGHSSSLPGEIDFNFLVVSDEGSKFILKVSRPNCNPEEFDFQEKLLSYLAECGYESDFPILISCLDGKKLVTIADNLGHLRAVRMLHWIEGGLWSSIQPVSDNLLYSLGEKAGKITHALFNFNHSFALRSFDWNLDTADWVEKYLHLFISDQKDLLLFFIEKFKKAKPDIGLLRKSVIHNDANDNNILVQIEGAETKVKAIIDFGDAVYSTTINDLAVAIAYAVMGKNNPLRAAEQIVRGYHSTFNLKAAEVALLYVLVAMRLVISVTKSAINREKEPDNVYLQISDKSGWNLLNQWKNINENYAIYTFRHCIGLDAHPNNQRIKQLLSQQNTHLSIIFPTLGLNKTSTPDMSVGSNFLGHRTEFDDNDILWNKIQAWNKSHPNTIPANGYLETRPFYSTDAYKKEGNNGFEYRTVHLGIDYWVEPNTPVHSPLNGTIYSVINNDAHKDYGPTVIIKHELDSEYFYTLYGHLSQSTLSVVHNGQEVKKGDLIGYIGGSTENGHWAPHLHFQIILDMMEYTFDFPGVSFPNEKDVWKSICPDPRILFETPPDCVESKISSHDILNLRKKYLGKSLSVSYNKPLHIVRGEGTFLLDNSGRKYLDTVNNVAHVGHEHHRVVKAGINQMSVLNTNTRYLDENIVRFAENLLSTLPSELCVVHFVNSGSEANELALRMAYTHTNQKDILALEVGYHGNTTGCIDISSYKFDGKGGKGKPKNTHIIPLPDIFRGLHRDDQAGESYSKYAFDIINTLRDTGKSPAAFIHESIVSCGGQIVLPPRFLSMVYHLVRSAGGICIADEVQTGLGRVGNHWWAFEDHNIVPDIVTIGKPLGNGHPVGAVVCTKKIADTFANGMEYFNTFGGNPVSSTIGNELINVVKEEGLMYNAENTGKYLLDGLNMIKQTASIIQDVRGKGLFLGFELTNADLIPLPFQTLYLTNRMCEMGILTSIDGPDQNVIKIKPPLCFNQLNADEFLRRTEMILKENFMQI